jgi:hypothetical protein
MSGVMLEQQKVVLMVDPGVCRFKAKVTTWMEEGKLRCHIETGCKHVQEFAAALGPCEMMEVLHMPFSENQVYEVGGRTLKHATCPLPMAVLKGFEVSAGLGLKRAVSVVFEG